MSLLKNLGGIALNVAGLSTGVSLKAAVLQIAARAASNAIQKRLSKRGYNFSPAGRIGSPGRQTPSLRRLAERKENVSIVFNGVDGNGERVSRVISEWQGIPHDRAILFSKAVTALMTQLTDKLNRDDY